VIGLFVCHVRALCTNGKDIETISFVYDSPTSLPDRVKIWLLSVTPISLNFAPKWATSVDVSVGVGDIRWQTAAEWLEMAQCS